MAQAPLSTLLGSQVNEITALLTCLTDAEVRLFFHRKVTRTVGSPNFEVRKFISLSGFLFVEDRIYDMYVSIYL